MGTNSLLLNLQVVCISCTERLPFGDSLVNRLTVWLLL